MEKLTLVPRGDIDASVDYGNRTVSFENGVKQIQRQWVSPRVSVSFTAEGDKTMRDYLVGFIDKVHGNLDPFLWTYNGQEVKARFAEPKIAWKEINGYGGAGIVGYRGTVSIEFLKDSEK